jgi:AraC-like DNA-binding protein
MPSLPVTTSGSSLPFIERTPEKLVENRSSFAGKEAVFSIYDTYTEARQVELHAPSVMYCGMISGKKVVHTAGNQQFDFLPGQSLVLHPRQTIHIDFPDARHQQPTSCITLEIPVEKIKQVMSYMNETRPRLESHGSWDYDESSFIHFNNTRSVDMVISKLAHLFTGEHEARDMLTDLNTTELIIHLLQCKSRAFIMDLAGRKEQSSGLAAAIRYIKEHLGSIQSVDEAAEVACMSKASFYRHFRNETGESPLQFLNRERLSRAARLMRQNPGQSVASLSYQLGFSSTSHFIRLFKKQFGATPGRYLKS